MNFRLREYLSSFKLSTFRLLVIGVIVASVFLTDHFLKQDVSDKLADAWQEACISQISVSACAARIETHHQRCFEPSYSSMLLRFGSSRWEALKITQYEDCMSEDYEPRPQDGAQSKFSVTKGLER
ncbi:MAG: hypothetical protein AAF387_11365 [Pseudomonadota bacterium]